MVNKKLMAVFIAMIFTVIGYAQQKTVTGAVTSGGFPLPGVNIVVKGTTNGVVSDFDGNYSITFETEGSVLVFSYIGYEVQEISVNDSAVVNAVMVEDLASLDEVVVVGYGTQKRKDLTGAIQTISSDEITRTPTTSLDQSLGGQVSGVYIASRGGDAAAPINVRIRGSGTTGDNRPLFVIDGIPLVATSNQTVNTASSTESNPLATLNPNDIESINVLKDASATAIYGARAANGVVLITTKRGKNGEAKITYDVYTTISSNRKKYDVLNTEQYIDYQDELQAGLGEGHDFSSFRGLPTADWQGAIYRTGHTVNHNIGIRGGNEKGNYSISAGYLDQKGIQLAQNFERYSFSANSDVKVGKHFKFGQSLLFGSSDRLVQSEPGAAAHFLSATNVPFFAIYDANGNYNQSNEDTVGPASWNGGDRQIVGLNDLASNETRVKTNRILGSIYGEVKIIEGLKYRFTAGIDYQVGEGQFLQGGYDFGEGEQNTPSAGPGVSLLVKERPIEKTVNLSNVLTYDKSFGDHNFTFLVGHDETRFQFTKLRGQAIGLISETVLFTNTGLSSTLNEEGDEWAIRGYLGRINYNYDGKYLFTANMRRDETSRFGPDNRIGYFPSVALGWRLSQEKFLENSKIDDLKLRVSWGETGNQNTGANNAYYSQLILTPAYVLGVDQTPIIAPTAIVLANDNLHWETSTQTNIGVDLALLNRDLSFSVDYYIKNTKDILVQIPYPAVTGFANPTDVNLGEIQNSGLELSANYNKSISDDFSFGINANFSTLKNEVVDLDGFTLLAGNDNISRTMEGESMAHFYGYKTNGLYQTDAEAAAALPDDESFGAASAGDIRFVDVNGDGEITIADKTKIGSPLPTFLYGLNLSANYKNLDFSIFFQGVGGNSVYNQARQELEGLDGYSNQTTSTLNRWVGEGTSNSFPRLDPLGTNNNNRFSDRWVESAAYTRLKNIQIGYNFDADRLSGMFNGLITNIRLYAGAQNLAVFTKYSGLDPEVTRAYSYEKGENNLSTGVDDGYSPPNPVSVQFGARITF